MDKTKIMQHMHELGLVPVLRASSAEEAITIADAILAGGVNILEVTMTVPGAIRVIEQLANHHGTNCCSARAQFSMQRRLATACLLEHSSSSVRRSICAQSNYAAATACRLCPEH